MQTNRTLRFVYLLLAAFAGWPNLASAADRPAIAIIIDDIGYRAVQDRAALGLPGPLSYAVLAQAPGAVQARKLAQANGSEIILHLPMESANHAQRSADDLVPGVLTSDMSWASFVRTLHRHLAAVPDAIAVNNHEGSRLTADKERMQWLMQALAVHGDLAFVDSRTTHRTVALQEARYSGLPAVRRDVFLDPQPGEIAVQFQTLIDLAKEKGIALGIAHPYPETVAFLRRHLPGLRQQGVDLIKLSEMIRLKQKMALQDKR